MNTEKERIRYYFRFASLLTCLIISLGVVFYMAVEKLSFVDAFYFSVVTLATVGYGDITPQTEIGKIFTAFYIMLGIGIIGSFANLLLRNAALNRETKRVTKK